MSKRLYTALLGVAIAVLAAGAAEARVNDKSAISSHSSLSRTGVSQNFKARSSQRYATAKSSKHTASARSGRGHTRTASRRAVRSYDGGSSRSCLSSAARGLLNRIEAQFGAVEIVSTCRPGAVIAGSGKPSLHRHGQAIDFSAGSRKGAIVNWLIANHHSGGTMTYRDMNHVHVDIGYHFVSLGANSRRG